MQILSMNLNAIFHGQRAAIRLPGSAFSTSARSRATPMTSMTRSGSERPSQCDGGMMIPGAAQHPVAVWKRQIFSMKKNTGYGMTWQKARCFQHVEVWWRGRDFEPDELSTTSCQWTVDMFLLCFFATLFYGTFWMS